MNFQTAIARNFRIIQIGRKIISSLPSAQAHPLVTANKFKRWQIQLQESFSKFESREKVMMLLHVAWWLSKAITTVWNVCVQRTITYYNVLVASSCFSTSWILRYFVVVVAAAPVIVIVVVTVVIVAVVILASSDNCRCFASHPLRLLLHDNNNNNNNMNSARMHNQISTES